MWGDDSNSYGSGSSSDPIVVGGDSSLQLTGMQPKKKKWQSFLGGAEGGGGVAGGLKSLAGSGGVGGAIGNVAKFLL